MYLIYLNSSLGGGGIVSDIQNCKTGFEIAITYGVPQPPPDGPGGAISFWPGGLVGASGGYDWLFQPLLTQGEFSDSGWQVSPAVWIQNPDGSTAAQLGWADGIVAPGSTMFVPRPGDLMKARISYDKATGNWLQAMQDVTTGEFFSYYITAGKTYRNQYTCPDNALFELIYFTIECAFQPSVKNIWQGSIDANAAFTVDSRAHAQDFSDASKWTGTVYPGISDLGLKLGNDHFKMVLPTAEPMAPSPTSG